MIWHKKESDKPSIGGLVTEPGDVPAETVTVVFAFGEVVMDGVEPGDVSVKEIEFI